MGGLQFKTTTEKLSNNWYGWETELVPESLRSKEVDHVEYILHPSFANRIRRRERSDTNYRLNLEGYEGFSLHVNVYFENQDEVSGIIELPPQ